MNANIDKKHATRDGHGNVTAKNQNGIDVNGKPIKKPWQFGDSLADVKPDNFLNCPRDSILCLVACMA